MVKKLSASSRREKQKKENASEWVLSREAMARLKALEEMPDSEIDFSDIPLKLKLDWSNAVVGKYYRPWKKQISLRVDVDILIFFQMMGKRYQTRMNEVLREYMDRKRREYDLKLLADKDTPSIVQNKTSAKAVDEKISVKLKTRRAKKKLSSKVSVPARSTRKKTNKKRSPRK